MDHTTWAVVGGLAAIALLQGPVGEANTERRRNDFRYTPRPEVMKVLAGAHRSTLADMVWLRALPDMSREFDDLELKERWLDGSLRVVTELEPRWYTPYQYGATYLALLDRKAHKAIDLLERGVQARPEDSRLLRDLGMLHFEHLKDRETAFTYLERAAAQPDCDILTRRMVARWQVDRRADLPALAYWGDLLEHGNESVRRLAALEFEATRKQIVLRVAKEFAEREGRDASTKAELLDPDLLVEEAAQVVLGSFTMDADGNLAFPRHDELALEAGCRAVEDWAQLFRREEGRWPTLQEIRISEVRVLPRPPAGKAWRFDEGELELIDSAE